MINRVVLVGRLTKDPDLKYTPSGVAMARFTLALNRTFSNQQGEREADFINCLVWRKQAENAANYLKKVNHKSIGKIFIVTWTDIRHDYDWLKPYVDRAIIFDAEEENPEYHQRVLN